MYFNGMINKFIILLCKIDDFATHGVSKNLKFL